MDWIYKNFYKNELKKECNSIGLFLLAATFSMTAVYIILQIFIGIVDYNSLLSTDNISTFLMSSIASAMSMFLIGILYCLVSGTDLAKTVAFEKTKPSLLFPLILFGWAVAFIANYLGSLFYSAVSIFGLTTDIETKYGEMNWLEIALYVLSVSIIPALAEEFAFRGIILGKLRKHGDAFAIFTSALLFGMMHGNIVQIPFAFLVGLALAFVTVKANSLLPAIIVHFLNNFISVLFSVFTENNLLSEPIQNIIYFIIILIILTLGILSTAYFSRNKAFFVIKDNNELLSFGEKLSACFSNAGIIIFTVYVIITTIIYIITL